MSRDIAHHSAKALVAGLGLGAATPAELRHSFAPDAVIKLAHPFETMDIAGFVGQALTPLRAALLWAGDAHDSLELDI